MLVMVRCSVLNISVLTSVSSILDCSVLINSKYCMPWYLELSHHFFEYGIKARRLTLIQTQVGLLVQLKPIYAFRGILIYSNSQLLPSITCVWWDSWHFWRSSQRFPWVGSPPPYTSRCCWIGPAHSSQWRGTWGRIEAGSRLCPATICQLCWCSECDPDPWKLQALWCMVCPHASRPTLQPCSGRSRQSWVCRCARGCSWVWDRDGWRTTRAGLWNHSATTSWILWLHPRWAVSSPWATHIIMNTTLMDLM